MFKNKEGFTLVEVAIVLTIMGLLAVAAVSGAVLLKSAQTRAIIAEVENYKVAVDNFVSQYEGLPGDLKNATKFWPVVTIDGDNDGKVSPISEYYSFWHHLILSNIVSFQIQDPGNANSDVAQILLNMPQSGHFEGGYSARWDDAPMGYVDVLNRNFPGNYFYLAQNNNNNYLNGEAFKGEDALAFDNKIDDGFPDSGNVLSAGGACTIGSAPDIVYRLTNETISCYIAILFAGN